MQLFYNPDISENDNQVIFQKDESRHIVKVLRKTEGDELSITNGTGMLFKAQIIQADIKQCIASISSFESQPAPPYYLHMIVAPTKMNDRYEWFLEKAMEIGVHEITPVICDHSERKIVKLERYQRVLLSAMKQSLHMHFPKLNDPVSFSELMQTEMPGMRLIAHCEDDEKKPYLQNKLKANSTINILIGPEGDFSPNEIKTAMKENWQQISLGESRLRTETAAIAACHTVALINQNS